MSCFYQSPNASRMRKVPAVIRRRVLRRLSAARERYARASFSKSDLPESLCLDQVWHDQHARHRCNSSASELKLVERDSWYFYIHGFFGNGLSCSQAVWQHKDKNNSFNIALTKSFGPFFGHRFSDLVDWNTVVWKTANRFKIDSGHSALAITRIRCILKSHPSG